MSFDAINLKWVGGDIWTFAGGSIDRGKVGEPVKVKIDWLRDDDDIGPLTLKCDLEIDRKEALVILTVSEVTGDSQDVADFLDDLCVESGEINLLDDIVDYSIASEWLDDIAQALIRILSSEEETDGMDLAVKVQVQP